MLQLKRTIGGFMISTDGSQGAKSTARPIDHSTTNNDEAKSLDFITKNIQELTGFSDIELYKEAERKWSQTRSVKAGPISTSLSNIKIREIDKDGNCLLHSVIQGLGLPISHQELRKKVVENIDTKLPSFKQELLEYFEALPERTPFFNNNCTKEDLLEALNLNISDLDPDKEKIQRATQHYLIVIQKVGISLGGSVIETLQRLYKVNFDIRDKNFNKIQTFYNPLFNQTLTLRLRDEHYDIIERD